MPSSIQRRSLNIILLEDTFFLGSWDRRAFEECLKGLLYPLKSPSSLWHLRKHCWHCARAKSSSSGCHGPPSAWLLWARQPAASFTEDFGHHPQMQDSATALPWKWLHQAQHSKQLTASQSACRCNNSSQMRKGLHLFPFNTVTLVVVAPVLSCSVVILGKNMVLVGLGALRLTGTQCWFSFFRHVFILENAGCVWLTENGILSNISIWMYELDRNWLQTCHCTASHHTEWLSTSPCSPALWVYLYASFITYETHINIVLISRHWFSTENIKIDESRQCGVAETMKEVSRKSMKCFMFEI